MKNFYHFLCTMLCGHLLVLLGQSVACAQTWTPASPVIVCPGETGNYVLSGIPANYRFTSGIPPFVAGGTLKNTPAIDSNGSATFQVQWDDTPNGGKLTVAFESGTTSGNTTTWSSAGSKELVAKIRSVAGQPGPFGAGIIPYCSTAPFTVTLANIDYFPNVPNEQVTDYLWEVPTGWGVSGATLTASLGNTPSGFRVYKGTRSITLTPLPGGDVTLRVFQYSGSCNQTYYPSQPNRLISFPGAFQVRRTPTVVITSGPQLVYCGDRTPITYTAQVSQSQGNPTFSWSYPNGWAVQGPANQASIVLLPTGTGAGSVSVRATYACTNPGLVVEAPAISIAFSNNLKPIQLLELPGICDGQTGTLQASVVPGAQTYEWTLPPGALVPTTVAPVSPGGNRYVTSAPSLTVQGHVNPYQDGLQTVSVTAGGSGCGGSSATGSLVLGLGAQAVLGVSSPVSASDGYTVCANQPVQFSVSINQQQAPITGYDWTVDGQPYYPGQGLATVNLYTPSAGQSLTVSVMVSSNCGNLVVGRSVISASA